MGTTSSTVVVPSLVTVTDPTNEEPASIVEGVSVTVLTLRAGEMVVDVVPVRPSASVTVRLTVSLPSAA